MSIACLRKTVRTVNYYVDTSVVLRILLAGDRGWKGWGRWERAYCSSLLRSECGRAVDRLRLQKGWSDHTIAHVGDERRRLQRFLTKAALTPAVLNRAALPMPTIL